MKKIYFYATYSDDAASIIEANSKAQIKKASIHLFENYIRYNSSAEAFNFLMLNLSSLGMNINSSDIKRLDATNF